MKHRILNRTSAIFAISFLAVIVLFPLIVHAQVTVSLQQPPPNQLKVADLWRVTLINTSRETQKVYLQGTAKEASAGLIVDAQTTTFTLPPGTKIVTGRDVSPIKVNSSNGRYKNILMQTGTVPAGDYTICVAVKSATNGEELGNDCIEQHVANASLVLINPGDESTVEEDLPVFIWTTTPPLGTGATYTLKLVEVLGNQSPFAAMQSNNAFHMQSDIHTTTLQYPISAPKLIPGRSYAWQVTAFENGAALSTSEVWKFTFKSADTAVPYKLKKKELLTQFEKLYGGAQYDHGWAIESTKDSGYIIAGYTRSFGAGNDDGLLIKLDRSGDVQWARTFGGENDDGFYAVTQVMDGGYAAVGFTRSFDVGNDDIYVVKTSADGQPEYSRVLGGGGFDAGYAVTPSPEDGIVIAGVIGKGDDYDAYVAMLDKGGNPEWAENIGLYECDVAHAIARTANSGYIVAGYTRSGGMGNDDMYIISIGREGTISSISTFGSFLADRAEAITSVGGGSKFVIAGYRPNDQMTDAGDVCLLSIGPNGERIDVRDYNAGSIDKGISITETPDRGVVVAGYNSGDTAKPGGIIAFKTNVDGAVEWSRFYRDSKLDEGYGVVQARDGGYAIAGYSDAGPEGDVILIKTDSKGVVGCTDKDGGVQQVSPRGSFAPFVALADRGIVSRSVSSNTSKPPIKVEQLCPKPTTPEQGK